MCYELFEREQEQQERQAILTGLTPVDAYGFSFYLNRPHKFTVLNLLTRLNVLGIIRINGVDDIEGERGSISLLKKVIKYAHYLENQANRKE